MAVAADPDQGTVRDDMVALVEPFIEALRGAPDIGMGGARHLAALFGEQDLLAVRVWRVPRRALVPHRRSTVALLTKARWRRTRLSVCRGRPIGSSSMALRNGATLLELVADEGAGLR